jgi:pimeloyl-ACP methyl ester carboxylesterase
MTNAHTKRETIAGTTLLRRPGNGIAIPLVLLHGIGSNAESWAPMLSVLDPRIEAIAWDAPGYGSSAQLSADWPNPADYAARLEDILDLAGHRRVILAGHSLGALFAASFAASRPDRVAALALLSPASGYRVVPGHPLPPAVQSRIDDLHRLGSTTFAETRAPRLVYRPEQKPELVAAVQRAMSAVHPAGYTRAVRALGAGDLLADAALIQAPTMVAVGTRDVVTPPDGARAVFAALKHGRRLIEIPDCGHALPQEAPAAIAELLAGLVLDAGRQA